MSHSSNRHLFSRKLKCLLFSTLTISLLSSGLLANQSDVADSKIKDDLIPTDQYGRSPLHLAILARDEALVEAMVLSKKADIEAKDQKGQTPLIYAAAKDQAFMVQLLVENGANVNATDNIGRTALSFAAGHAAIRAAFILLRNDNIKVDQANHYGVTPLMYAVGPISKNYGQRVTDFIRRRMIIEFLIMSGANTKAETSAGLTAKDYAKTNRKMAARSFKAHHIRYKQAHKKRLKKKLVTAEADFAEHLTTLYGQKPADFSQTYFDFRHFLFRKSISRKKITFKEWSDYLLSEQNLFS